MKKYKFDVIVIMVFVLAAVVCFALFYSLGNAEGGYVQVIVDREVKETLPLNENRTYAISGDGCVNKIKIEDGSVWMMEADCPDKLCIKQGQIDKSGQSIICLPNKVVIKIVSGQTNDVDAVAE